MDEGIVLTNNLRLISDVSDVKYNKIFFGNICVYLRLIPTPWTAEHDILYPIIEHMRIKMKRKQN